MASIYARGEVLWMNFKNQLGRRECRSTGLRVGQEAQARELAAEVERQATEVRGTTAKTRRRGPDAPPVIAPKDAIVPPRAPHIGHEARDGALTVEQYGEQWIKRRKKASATQEAAQLRTHVFPLIGQMALADVRPKHIRDLVEALKEKRSVARKCKDKKLAPRTVLHIYGCVRLMFKGAVVDDHIETSPVVVEMGVLPMNVDKDPDWRPSAIFDRDEVIALISDPRIAEYRRVAYAIEALAGVRHGEMAGVRWSSYDETTKPLGRLVISRSGEKQGTKTQLTRQVPVHPTLAKILTRWKRSGWAEKYGREPRPDDLVLPTHDLKVRKAAQTLKAFRDDLAMLGFRTRRSHDLRRTFITLALVDGARRDVLKPLTHPSKQDILNLYTSYPWPTICEEVAKLRVDLPADVAAAGTPPSNNEAPATIARAPKKESAQRPEYAPTDVASYNRCYRDANLNISNDIDQDLLVRKP